MRWLLQRTPLLLGLLVLSAPFSVQAISTDKSQYTTAETISVTCTMNFQAYDITSGSNAESIGYYICEGVTEFSESTADGHTYALLELSGGNSCDFKTYGECKNQSYFVAEATFTVSNPSGGSGGPTTISVNKSRYSPDETILVTCSSSSNAFQLYDRTDGTDSLDQNLGGNYCGYPAAQVSFETFGTYAAVELSSGNSCNDKIYSECKNQGFFLSEVSFTVGEAESLGAFLTNKPSITLFSPLKEGGVFSRQISIGYSAEDVDDKGPDKGILGLIGNPVNLYYSKTVYEWFKGTAIGLKDKIVVANDQPASSTYMWDTSLLTPGVFYRFIAEVVDASRQSDEDASEFFTVDFDAPQFTITTDPPATRGENVTIRIESSKELRNAPTVTVTQTGGETVALSLQGDGILFEGVYEIVPQHDGIAKISVTGTDRAGNISSTIVSGGTFGVGIDPPPSPHISFPRDNDVVGTSTTIVKGSARNDTKVILTVNGTDTYMADPDDEGNFSVPDVRLDKVRNRGTNTISVVAQDQHGIVGEAAAVRVKFNSAPTILINEPAEFGLLGGTTPIDVEAIDENGDTLQFTYQVLPADLFDSTSMATSTNNDWLTIAEAIPTPRFQWDAGVVEDGEYVLRVLVDDGIEKVYSEPRKVTVRNTAPFIRFEDGRKTIVRTDSATVIGHATTPSTIFPRPVIGKVEYSIDGGKKWKTVKIDQGTTDARFSVTFSNLKEGTHPLLWRVTDGRKLVGRSSHPIIVDTMLPKPPRILSPKQGAMITSENDTDRVKQGMQIAVSGTAEAGTLITLTIGTSTRTVKTAANSAFVFRDVQIENRGLNTLVMQATDEAGNVSSETRANIVYDNPPAVSILEPKKFRALQGKATVRWRIEDTDADPISAVVLSYRRANGAWQTLPIEKGQDTFAWDVTSFEEGSEYQLQLEASDGIASSTAVSDFSIDRTLPGEPTLVLERSILRDKDTLSAEGTARDALSGVEFVEYAIADANSSEEEREWSTALITRGFLEHSAVFSIKHPVRLGDNTYQLFVRAVDAAGNTSRGISQKFLVDATPPRVGNFSIVKNGTRIPPDKNGVLTSYVESDTVFSISLETDAARSTVHLGNKDFSLSRNIANGLWETTLTPPATGTPVLISAEDEVGNTVFKKQIGSLSPKERGMVEVYAPGGTPEPISGVMISVFRLDQYGRTIPLLDSLLRGTSMVETDKEGEYELALEQGTYELVAQKEGYRTVAHALTLDTPSLVNIAFSTEEISSVRAFIQSIQDYFNYEL